MQADLCYFREMEPARNLVQIESSPGGSFSNAAIRSISKAMSITFLFCDYLTSTIAKAAIAHSAATPINTTAKKKKAFFCCLRIPARVVRVDNLLLQIGACVVQYGGYCLMNVVAYIVGCVSDDLGFLIHFPCLYFLLSCRRQKYL